MSIVQRLHLVVCKQLQVLGAASTSQEHFNVGVGSCNTLLLHLVHLLLLLLGAFTAGTLVSLRGLVLWQHDEEDRQEKEGEEQLQEKGHLRALLTFPDGDSTGKGEDLEDEEEGGDVEDAAGGRDFEDFLGRQEESSGGEVEEELEEQDQHPGTWPGSSTTDCPGPGTLPQAGHGTVLLGTDTHIWNWQLVSHTSQPTNTTEIV